MKTPQTPAPPELAAASCSAPVWRRHDCPKCHGNKRVWRKQKGENVLKKCPACDGTGRIYSDETRSQSAEAHPPA